MQAIISLPSPVRFLLMPTIYNRMNTINTFQDFFKDTFLKDQPFAGFRPGHFKTLYEARRHDVAKMPVNFDHDDIQFLQQFPHAFWAKAKQQRYNLLFDALEKLHHERRSLGHEAIKDAIKSAATTQNWSPLNRLMPDDLVGSMARHLRPAIIRDMKPRQLDIEADKLAHEYLKSRTDRVEDPHEAEFTFQANDYDPHRRKNTSSYSTAEKVTYIARPYLNRLYHKLERTKGLPHTPDSGLEGDGKYGYDLAEPTRSTNPGRSANTKGRVSTFCPSRRCLTPQSLADEDQTAQVGNRLHDVARPGVAKWNDAISGDLTPIRGRVRGGSPAYAR